MVKKIIALALVLGVIGGVLAGCGSSDAGSGAAAPAPDKGAAPAAPATTA